MPGFGQQAGGVLGGGHRERVDDAAALQILQVGQQPAEPFAGIGQGQDTQPERIPAQGAADGEHVLAELFLDVMHHPGVGRGGGGEHRDGVRQLRDEVRDAPVVGAEVVAPVRDAVGLVNHQQPGPADELGQLVFPEGRVGESFRRDQQDVHFIGGELLADGVPVQLVRGVDRHRPHPGPRRGRDLVPHERQERGHDQGGPGAAAAQQQGGDKVHGRLPPAGALHHQGPPAAVDQGLNGLELAVMELRFRMAHELPQYVLGLFPGRGCGAGVGQCWKGRSGYWPLLQYPSPLRQPRSRYPLCAQSRRVDNGADRPARQGRNVR